MIIIYTHSFAYIYSIYFVCYTFSPEKNTQTLLFLQLNLHKLLVYLNNVVRYVNVEFFFLFCPAQVEWNCYMFLRVPSSGNGKIPQHPKPHVEFGWNYSLRLLNSGHTKWLIYWIIVNKVWLICFQHFFPPLVLGF